MSDACLRCKNLKKGILIETFNDDNKIWQISCIDNITICIDERDKIKNKNKSSFSSNLCMKKFSIKIVNTNCIIKDIKCNQFKTKWRYIDVGLIGKRATYPMLYPMAPIQDISSMYIDYYYQYIHKDDDNYNNKKNIHHYNDKNKNTNTNKIKNKRSINHIDDVSSEEDEDQDEDQKKDPDYNEKEDMKQQRKSGRKRSYSQFLSKKKKKQIDGTVDLVSTSDDEKDNDESNKVNKRRKLSDDEPFEIVEIVEKSDNTNNIKTKIINKKKAKEKAKEKEKEKKIEDSDCFEKVEKFCKENNNKYPTFAEIEKLCDIGSKQAKALILRYFSHTKDMAEYVVLKSDEYKCQCTKCLQIFGGLTAIKRMQKHITTVHSKEHNKDHNKNQNKDKNNSNTKTKSKSKSKSKTFNFHDYNINRNRSKIKKNNDNSKIPPPLSPFND